MSRQSGEKLGKRYRKRYRYQQTDRKRRHTNRLGETDRKGGYTKSQRNRDRKVDMNRMGESASIRNTYRLTETQTETDM